MRTTVRPSIAAMSNEEIVQRAQAIVNLGRNTPDLIQEYQECNQMFNERTKDLLPCMLNESIPA